MNSCVIRLWQRLAFSILLAVLPGLGFSANLVTNGSFETGLTGWTASGACVWQSLTAGSSTTPGSFSAPAATDGTHVLMSDTTQSDTGPCTLYQDVAIPAGGNSSLTLAAGYNVWNYGEFGADASCSVAVEVTTPAGAPIATVFSASAGNTAALAPRPALNLSAQNGSTVRIIVKANSCNGASFGSSSVVGAVLDNVVLDHTGPAALTAVPTLSEWGLILLAFMIAGVAVPATRRRN